jgi:hypothetical protein
MLREKPDASGEWWSAILTDIQFWIPVAVLAVGLLVLRWIS